MTWYMQPSGDGLQHSGSLVSSMVHTDCRIAFAASAAMRVDPAPGGDQPHPQRICPKCQPAEDAR